MTQPSSERREDQAPAMIASSGRAFWLNLWGGRPPHPLLLLVAFTAAALTAVPLVYVLIRSAQGGPEVWKRLWETRIPLLLANSLKLTLLVTALSTLLGVPLAWITIRTDLPGARHVRWIATLPMVYPSFVGAFAYISVFGRRGLLEQTVSRLLGIPVHEIQLPSIYGLWGTGIIMALFSYPYLYLLVAAAFRNLNPSMEEAAQAAGLSPIKVFWRVAVPLVKPAIGAGSLLVSFHALAEFGTVAMLRYETFTSAIYLQLIGRYDRSAAAALSAVLVAFTISLVVAESYVQRRARFYQTGGTWRSPQMVSLGAWRYPALVCVILVLLASVVLPGALLVYWSYRGIVDGVTTEVWRLAWNSLVSSGLGATLATLMAFSIGYLVTRSRGPGSRLLYQLSFSGYALPGVVVALAMIVLFNTYFSWVYGTIFMMVAGYVVRFLPETLGAQHAALSQISPNVEEAARSCGHSGFATVRRVTLPLAMPGVVAGWSLVFLNCLKELPATLLLRPAGYDTLAVRLWDYAAEGFYSRGGLPGLLLVLLALPPLILLVARVLQGRTSIS